MKKIALLLALCLVLTCLPVSALASVYAIPNQQLALRTGPNTKYAELYTLPQSTDIRAIEYEEGNGVTWVLVEFTKDGERVCGYTGLKRMSVQGSIPWAYHDYSDMVVMTPTVVYAAPSYYGAERGWLGDFEYVTLLRFDEGMDNPSDSFAYVEFFDLRSECLSRGWVPSDCIAYDSCSNTPQNDAVNARTCAFTLPMQNESAFNAVPCGYRASYVGREYYGVPAVLNQRMALRTGPNTKYAELYTMPQSTRIEVLEYEEGNGVLWAYVEFMKDGKYVRGYTGAKRMTVFEYAETVSGDEGPCWIDHPGFVYAAPCYNSAIRGEVDEGERCLLLNHEDEYAYIEFYDASSGCLSRGYVEDFRIYQ